MQLFPDWLLEKQYQLQLSDDERHLLKTAFEFLADTALEQPRVLVHRDYHSRNLMVLEKQNPGILDFQDAVIGPICYDLVSLLKDCYISWPRQQVLNWLSTYFSRPPISRLVAGAGYKQIIRWFDLMGIQRHLKASGIFARLYLRDGKSRYLNDIPRTLQYISQVVADYPELEPFAHFLEERVLPAARAQDNRIIV
jgi:aminoglycoside/choline kinase family phosphotransferase